MMITAEASCSWCMKLRHEVAALFESIHKDMHICDECIELLHAAVEERPKVTRGEELRELIEYEK